VYRRGRLENQIAMCIERAEKPFFVAPETRFHPLKRIDGDKEGIFDRGVISPKAYRPPGSVITSTVIRKLQGRGYPSVWMSKLDSIAKSDMRSSAAINRDTAHMRSMHYDRLMLVLHERGVQIRLADRKRLNWLLRGGNGRRLKQCDQSPIGSPRQPFDQLVVTEDNIFSGRLNALQVPKAEWITEGDGGPRCPDGQGSYLLVEPALPAAGRIADPARRTSAERPVKKPIGYLPLPLSKIAQV
jgi:hypothetical protein